MTVKQVIVIRKDLGMRRGKEIAQGSHASIAWLIKRLKDNRLDSFYELEPFEREWCESGSTKICLQIDSESGLDEIYAAAKKAGLEVHMITDAGATEFHGVPTKTCLAIGPDDSSKIDPITKELKLY